MISRFPFPSTEVNAGAVPVAPGAMTTTNPFASGMPVRWKRPWASVCVSRFSESFVQTQRTMAFAAGRPPGKVTVPVTSRPDAAPGGGPPAGCAGRTGWLLSRKLSSSGPEHGAHDQVALLITEITGCPRARRVGRSKTLPSQTYRPSASHRSQFAAQEKVLPDVL